MTGLVGVAAVAKAKSIAGSIPRGVWIALAVVAILLLGTCAHKKAVTKAYDAYYAQGKADEGQRIAAKALNIAAKATLISTKLRSKSDETNRRIAGDADAIRLRGPGKASCLNPATPRASGRQPAGRPADAAVDQVPSGEGLELIGVPFPDFVGAAERCDLNRAEVLTWREWHKQLTENWEKANR